MSLNLRTAINRVRKRLRVHSEADAPSPPGNAVLQVPPVQLDDLARTWDERGRRAGSAGWWHHLGEAAFILHARYPDQPQLATPLVGLVLRDGVLVWATARGLGSTRLLNAAAMLTDLLAAIHLARRIETADFVQDHALSQWGLSAAWVHAMTERQLPLPVLAIYPLALQAGLAHLWKLDRRDTAWYVIKEGYWSVATLWAVHDLREVVDDVVTEGAAATHRQAMLARRTQRLEARNAMSEIVWRWIHRDGISALGTVAFVAEARSSDHNSCERAALRRIAELAQFEAAGLRARAPIDELSIASRIGRIFAVRAASGDRTSWVGAAMPAHTRTSSEHLDEIDALEQLLCATRGELELSLTALPDHIRLWARGQFDGPIPSIARSTPGHDTRTLEADIPCR